MRPTPPLIMPQRLHNILFRSFFCRRIAEDDADGGRHRERDKDTQRADDGQNIRNSFDAKRQDNAQDNPDDAAEDRNQRRFYQKLRGDIFFPRADRTPDADFADALHDRR